jgi:hypothetical protein
MCSVSVVFCESHVSQSFPTSCSLPISDHCRQLTQATEEGPGVYVDKPSKFH